MKLKFSQNAVKIQLKSFQSCYLSKQDFCMKKDAHFSNFICLFLKPFKRRAFGLSTLATSVTMLVCIMQLLHVFHYFNCALSRAQIDICGVFN